MAVFSIVSLRKNNETVDKYALPFLNIDSILVLMPDVVQYVEKYKKNIAVDMRKRGFSYSEIENRRFRMSTAMFFLYFST